MSGPQDPPRRARFLDVAVSGLGLVLVALLVITGLVVVGIFVFVFVGMSRFGSNK